MRALWVTNGIGEAEVVKTRVQHMLMDVLEFIDRDQIQTYIHTHKYPPQPVPSELELLELMSSLSWSSLVSGTGCRRRHSDSPASKSFSSSPWGASMNVTPEEEVGTWIKDEQRKTTYLVSQPPCSDARHQKIA